MNFSPLINAIDLTNTIPSKWNCWCPAKRLSDFLSSILASLPLNLTKQLRLIIFIFIIPRWKVLHVVSFISEGVLKELVKYCYGFVLFLFYYCVRLFSLIVLNRVKVCLFSEGLFEMGFLNKAYVRFFHMYIFLSLFISTRISFVLSHASFKNELISFFCLSCATGKDKI